MATNDKITAPPSPFRPADDAPRSFTAEEVEHIEEIAAESVPESVPDDGPETVRKPLPVTEQMEEPVPLDPRRVRSAATPRYMSQDPRGPAQAQPAPGVRKVLITRARLRSASTLIGVSLIIGLVIVFFLWQRNAAQDETPSASVASVVGKAFASNRAEVTATAPDGTTAKATLASAGPAAAAAAAPVEMLPVNASVLATAGHVYADTSNCKMADITVGEVNDGPLKMTHNKCVQMSNFIDMDDIPVE